MIKIGIVEDDIIIRQMYTMKFEAEGFEVSIGTNGEEAIELVRRLEPDILLLDISMPILDGAAALVKIRQTDVGRSLPVVFLTNLGEEEAPKSLHKLNISGYIVKAEMTPRQVVAYVKDVLRQKNLLPAEQPE